jgi:hypothetical protein
LGVADPHFDFEATLDTSDGVTPRPGLRVYGTEAAALVTSSSEAAIPSFASVLANDLDLYLDTLSGAGANTWVAQKGSNYTEATNPPALQTRSEFNNQLAYVADGVNDQLVNSSLVLNTGDVWLVLGMLLTGITNSASLMGGSQAGAPHTLFHFVASGSFLRSFSGTSAGQQSVPLDTAVVMGASFGNTTKDWVRARPKTWGSVYGTAVGSTTTGVGHKLFMRSTNIGPGKAAIAAIAKFPAAKATPDRIQAVIDYWRDPSRYGTFLY